MRYVAATAALAIVLTCFPGSAAAQNLYKWKDENGVLHIATSLEDVPQRYRDQVSTLEAEPASETPSEPAGETPPAEEPEEPPVEEAELNRFEVPYENEGTARRVIIPVTFNDSVTAPMALDTGSPGMVISFVLAAKLGLFSRDGGTLVTEAAGIGGEVPAILTIIDSVSVEGARDDFIPTTVTFGLSAQFDGLIGMDFLANYTISIDTKKQVVVFEEAPPDPSSRGGHDEGWWRQTFADFRSMRDRWRERFESARNRTDGRATAFVEFQAREAERLLQQLDIYASENAVPRHWR